MSTRLNWAEKVKALEEYLKLPTTPVGWKVVKSPDEFPKEAKRPKRDYGFPITMCKANTMARTMGITTAFTAEDCDCYNGLLFWGWGELEGGWKVFEDYWMDGKLIKKTREAAKAHIEALKKFSFKKGECGGVVISPAKLGLIDPDAIWVYGNPTQVEILLWAFLREGDGKQKLTFSGLAVCLDAVIQTTRTQEAGILPPCPDDRRSGTQDYEMIFAFPRSKLDEIVEGLRVFAEYGSWVYPWKLNLTYPSYWPPKAKELISKIKR